MNASPSDLKKVANWMSEFNYLIKKGTFSEDTIEILSNDLFSLNVQYKIKDYIKSWNNFRDNLKKLESKLHPRSKLIFKKETEDVSFDKGENS